MPADRHRGRRSAANDRNMSRAEREIREAQQKRLDAAAALEDSVTSLAKTISTWMEEGVGTSEIGTWLTSPEKPKGVTRQQVYKLVAERVDGKVMRSDKPKAKLNGAAPKRPARPTRSRPTR